MSRYISKQTSILIPTLREAPAEAEARSHQLLLRAGFIRQLAAGIYSYLPLGWRVLRRIESIVREEMEDAGFQELLLPAMQPAELWERSGRYGDYGAELIRLQDRHEREFVLGPTHEEVITALAAAEVNTYRKLPLRLYQIQTKFRDERRPRFGLLRGREFLMKDAYSFDRSWEDLDRTYQAARDAYRRIFTRCGLKFSMVEAEAGSIGGEGETHEFMAPAEIGEDTIVSCPACGYAANLEKAAAAAAAGERSEEEAEHQAPAIQKVATPNTRTIEEVSAFLRIPASSILKTMIYMADGEPVAAIVRGDHEVNENKLTAALGCGALELAEPQDVLKITGTPHGYAGPVGLHIPVYLDRDAVLYGGAVAGAGEAHAHVRNVVPFRDFQPAQIGDYRSVQEGDRCPNCAEALQFAKGIEVGHIFKLGTKYSSVLDAGYTDEAGREQTMIMGCYGIGISRLLSAVAEQSLGDQGMCWPLGIAPHAVHLIPVSTQDPDQAAVVDQIATELARQGVECLIDDREERPGVKFKDADLIGLPLRIVVGKRAGEGIVEWTDRRGGVRTELTWQEAVRLAAGICSTAGETL
ncbi:proline--tRNA ligase [Paenibacillus sp. XY044]|uniref:proline--tRNA ligase n=1 Tax=Paenibacillus sp. XY044 TaxID=2026089 RepID=UPI000B97E157|nr:proline--tRNA ligase [Paenibacillus sp. XY044]OZB97989.1 proline--tRNA ligase [Paenibacillus sp. XY044]